MIEVSAAAINETQNTAIGAVRYSGSCSLPEVAAEASLHSAISNDDRSITRSNAAMPPEVAPPALTADGSVVVSSKSRKKKINRE